MQSTHNNAGCGLSVVSYLGHAMDPFPHMINETGCHYSSKIYSFLKACRKIEIKDCIHNYKTRWIVAADIPLFSLDKQLNISTASPNVVKRNICNTF
jgi:hypothetical protein